MKVVKSAAILSGVLAFIIFAKILLHFHNQSSNFNTMLYSMPSFGNCRSISVVYYNSKGNVSNFTLDVDVLRNSNLTPLRIGDSGDFYNYCEFTYTDGSTCGVIFEFAENCNVVKFSKVSYLSFDKNEHIFSIDDKTLKKLRDFSIAYSKWCNDAEKGN